MERRLARTLADHDTSRVALSKELHDAKHERNLTITQLRHLEKYGATDADVVFFDFTSN